MDLFREKFGEHIQLLRRQDVRGFVKRKPVWLTRPLGLETVRNQASAMEVETRNVYERAAARAQDVHCPAVARQDHSQQGTQKERNALWKHALMLSKYLQRLTRPWSVWRHLFEKHPNSNHRLSNS